MNYLFYCKHLSLAINHLTRPRCEGGPKVFTNIAENKKLNREDIVTVINDVRDAMICSWHCCHSEICGAFGFNEIDGSCTIFENEPFGDKSDQVTQEGSSIWAEDELENTDTFQMSARHSKTS